jgi:hypothetical protein
MGGDAPLRNIARTVFGLAVCTALVAGADVAHAVPWNQADRNRDGYVTWDEARVAFPGLARPHFNRADRNRDGVISRSEFPSLSTIYELMRN